MAQTKRQNKYQYETSPRKVNPAPVPKRNTRQPEKSTSMDIQKSKEEVRKAKRLEAKKRAKAVFYLVLGFSILFAIGYRNSQINESFAKKQAIERDISAVKKENEQLQVSIQNGLNLNEIEQKAKERLGMQKLSNKQTIYIELPKKDYVEPGTEEIIIKEEKESTLESILNTIKNIFK